MKKHRLILLRHAKSDWPEGVSDHDRPLAARGRKAAPAIGTYLLKENLLPQLVMVSTARRTQETWDLISTPAWPGVTKRDAAEIYEAPPGRLLAVIHGIEAAVGTLMVIGHNPGLQNLALLLIGGGDKEARERLQTKYPTAGLAVIDFALESWSDVTPGSGSLQRFVTPRSLD